MINGDVMMMEIRHIPNVCFNEVIGIRFCGNVDACLNYKNMVSCIYGPFVFRFSVS